MSPFFQVVRVWGRSCLSLGLSSPGLSSIVPIFARRGDVKTSRLEGNLREIGSPISLPGALRLVSGLNRCARGAERAQVYTYGALEILKVTIN
jgi:hypothetical protein